MICYPGLIWPAWSIELIPGLKTRYFHYCFLRQWKLFIYNFLSSINGPQRQPYISPWAAQIQILGNIKNQKYVVPALSICLYRFDTMLLTRECLKTSKNREWKFLDGSNLTVLAVKPKFHLFWIPQSSQPPIYDCYYWINNWYTPNIILSGSLEKSRMRAYSSEKRMGRFCLKLHAFEGLHRWNIISHYYI